MGTLYTVQAQMKCHISSGSALFAWTKSIFRERNTIVSERISYGPSVHAMDHPDFIVYIALLKITLAWVKVQNFKIVNLSNSNLKACIMPTKFKKKSV